MRLKPGSIDTRFAQTAAIGVPNRHKISLILATPIDPICVPNANYHCFHPDSVDSRSRFETYRFNFDFDADSWNSDFGSVPFDTATLQLKAALKVKSVAKVGSKRKTHEIGKKKVQQEQPSFQRQLHLNEVEYICYYAFHSEETSLKKKQKEKQKEQEKEKEKEKEDVVAEPKPKRNVKVSKMICSPYMERIAKIKDRVKADELVLCNSIFASKRDTKEKVWENDMGDMLYQSDVYTFKANFYINWRIINCWISIMNARECLKSDESPSRLFLHSDCMADYMLDGSVLELTRMNKFNMLFTATCNNLDINPNLRSIGLILMMEYYMLCFDMKKPSYVLIDHIVRMGTTSNRFEPIPLTLTPKCEDIVNNGSKNTESAMDDNNCGLYLMRHMECYMGEREGMWETGLTGKGMID
ncbi:hypothetical protein LXL04_013093 [Taraxacum kok-saghyz]